MSDVPKPEEKDSQPQKPAFKEDLKELFGSLRNRDQRTRKVGFLFYLSFVCLVGTLSLLVLKFFQNKAESKAKALAEEKRQARIAAELEAERKRNAPPPHYSLGTFTLPLNEQSNLPTGLRNVVEFEVSITCDAEETCKWIEEHRDMARGFLSAVMVPRDRVLFETPEGKRAYRDEITARLNVLLGSKGIRGRILEVYFPRFALS